MRAIIGIALALAAAWGLHAYGAGRIDGLLAAVLTGLAGWAAGWLAASLWVRRPPAPPAPKRPDLESQIVALLKSPDTGEEVASAGEKLLSAMLRRARGVKPGKNAPEKKIEQG